MTSNVADDTVWHPSPNFGPRRGETAVRLVVLHYTAMESSAAALERLCAREHEVSAHYLIGRDGRLWQMVREVDRAWHAGAAAWGSITDVNSSSIGIEIDNPGDAPFSEPSMQRLEHILGTILGQTGLGAEAVIGHSDCAPGRKADPGGRFDWRRLAHLGLAVWPEKGTDPGGPVEPLLRRAGYTYPAPVEHRLAAFRVRFRPGSSGPVTGEDRALLAALPAAP